MLWPISQRRKCVRGVHWYSSTVVVVVVRASQTTAARPPPEVPAQMKCNNSYSVIISFLFFVCLFVCLSRVRRIRNFNEKINRKIVLLRLCVCVYDNCQKYNDFICWKNIIKYMKFYMPMNSSSMYSGSRPARNLLSRGEFGYRSGGTQ